MDNRLFLIALLLVPGARMNAQEKTAKDTLTVENIIRDLPEVMVKGTRPVVKAERGALSYNMPLLLEQLPADDAYEAIKRIPGVSDADGILKFAGNTVTLILNGHATTLTQEQLTEQLKAMPADQLAKAEVMLAAPPRYHVRGMAINIVTKDRAGSNSVSGQITGMWDQSKYGIATGKGFLSVQRGKFGLDAQYSIRNGNRYDYTATEATQPFEGERKTYNEADDLKAFGNKHDYRLGLNYAFSKNHRLDVSYTGKLSNGSNDTHSTGTGTSHQHSNSSERLHNIDLNYTAPFGLRIDGSYTHYLTPQRQQLDGTLYETERNLTTKSRQTIDKWTASADQNHDLKHGWGLSYGLKAQFSHNNSDQTTLDADGNVLPDATSSADTDERIWNVYAGFSKQITQSISLEAAVAAEKYRSAAWDEWRIYPSLNALWTVNDNHTLNLSFSSSSSFPDYWAIMSGVYYASTYKEIWGNPDLGPQSFYGLNLMWQIKHRYTLSAFANVMPNYFTQLPYQPSDRMAVIFKEVNYDYSSVYGLQASAIFKAGKWLSGNAYAVARYAHEKCDDFFDLPFNRHKLSVILGTTTSVKLCRQHDLRFILDPFFQSEAMQGVYDVRPFFRLDATLQWASDNGKWTVKAMGNNLTNAKYKPQSVQGTQDFHMTTSPGWISGALSVTYKFGGYKAKAVKEIDTSRMGH